MIISFEDLKNIKNTNKKVVLTIGTFDLFHYEHLRYLKDAKHLGDILVTIVKDDFLASLKRAKPPIIKQEQRLEIIDSLKFVDYSILATKEIFEQTKKDLTVNFDDKNNEWLFCFYKIIEQLKPDILYHEDTTCFFDARNFVSKNFNIQLITRKRTEIVSTTKIIEKIRNI